MKRIERSALVPFSCQQMFDLVNDVERYPEFMPGCVGAELLERGEDWLVARLDLSRAGIRQSFVTRNQLFSPQRMTLQLERGPFAELRGQWDFQALGEHACKVLFWLEFEMSSALLGGVAGMVFEKVASEQVDALCQRARRLYPGI